MKAKWTSDDVPGQQGRLAVVTGANTGLGFETAQVLAARGASVVLAVRDIEKGKRAAASATPPPRPPRSTPCWPTRSPTPRSALHAADGAGQRADRPCAEQARRNRVYLVTAVLPIPPVAVISLDRVPGRLGSVVPPGRRGPHHDCRVRLFHLPPRVLLDPVVKPALGPAVAFAGPPARLERDVMFEVAP